MKRIIDVLCTDCGGSGKGVRGKCAACSGTGRVKRVIEVKQ